jgi:hypothetical protein
MLQDKAKQAEDRTVSILVVTKASLRTGQCRRRLRPGD